jgi:hypothetical protein
MTSTLPTRTRTRKYVDGRFINTGETIELAHWYRRGDSMACDLATGTFVEHTGTAWKITDANTGETIELPCGDYLLVIS